MSCATAGTHDDTKGVIRSRIFDEGQTTQWPKEEGQTTQWPKEGQTTQWPKEKGQKEQTTIYKTYIEN